MPRRSNPKEYRDGKKHTPSNCRLKNCKWNYLPPPEDSQECIGCEGNKKEVKHAGKKSPD
jgi:hypothetical protein